MTQRSAIPGSAASMLWHGLARDFPHAMKLVQRMCREEVTEPPPWHQTPAEKAFDEHTNRLLAALGQVARRCLLQYDSWSQTPDLLAQLWSQSTEEPVRLIGKCFARNDYRELAV